MIHLGIFIEPVGDLNSSILEMKDEIKNQCIQTELVSHPPHMTLIHGNYKNKQEIIEKFKMFKFNSFKIETTDFYYFKNDINTGLDTLVVNIIKSKELKALFEKILDIFKPDNSDLFKNYLKNDRFRTNILETGYPFDPEMWIPHFTIVSHQPNKDEKIKSIIKRYPVAKNFNVQNISLWEINKDIHFKIDENESI